MNKSFILLIALASCVPQGPKETPIKEDTKKVEAFSIEVLTDMHDECAEALTTCEALQDNEFALNCLNEFPFKPAINQDTKTCGVVLPHFAVIKYHKGCDFKKEVPRAVLFACGVLSTKIEKVLEVCKSE